jgi:hypothetical protein
MSSLLGSAGASPVVRHKGKKYALGALDQRAKDAFSTALKVKAAALLDCLPPARQEAATATLQRRVAVGDYDFHGPVAADALQTPMGAVLMLACLLDCEEQVALEVMAEQGASVVAMLQMRIKEAAPEAPEGGEGNG